MLFHERQEGFGTFEAYGDSPECVSPQANSDGATVFVSNLCLAETHLVMVMMLVC
jgi:hypothetical protein